MFAGIAYGVMAGALWGVIFLVPRVLDNFSAAELMVGRYVAYGLVSLAFLLPTLRAVLQRLERRDWITLLWLSVAGNLVYYLMLAIAVQRVGVAATSLVIGMLPVLVTLAGGADHNAVSLRKLIWPLAAIVLGVLCNGADVLTATLPAGYAQSIGAKLVGLLAATGALLAWSAYAVGNARYLMRRTDLSSHDWSLLMGVTTGVLALLVSVGVMAPLLSANTAPRAWGWFTVAMFAIAIGPSMIGTGLWNAATRRLPLTLGGQMIIFETVFALLYGFLYEARMPRPLELAAIFLLLGGVAGSSWVHAVRHPPEHPG
ncbi:DMT family transporter [Silvimonas soli]|uniref:DMT family transporter n=1 Tax=Silvimonas soli TaxID=2980100 RepID=UPI0024B3A463|nr:DMT family transporter [Silvimonas soli]